MLCLAAGYLFGCFLTAEVVARCTAGESAREIGSGNPGMANIMTHLGKRAGLLVLAGDVLKTAAACWFCWQLAPELHLTDEDLHAVVYRETGKESMKMLTQGEVNTVARVLQNMKDSVSRSVRDKRTDTGGDIRTTAQRRKIYALCEALGWNDDPRRIQGFVKRVAHVDRIEWLNMAQCEKVIEGLKAILARQRRKEAEL